MSRKIILSRKGFDSSNGGIPSPIFENGDMVSLPIPNDRDINKYSDLFYGVMSYWNLLNDLGYSSKNHCCHLDPGLYQNIKPRPEHWKACFGQSGVALRHLHKKEIDIGDVFLFFGWFRKVKEEGRKISFQKGSSDFHAVFGYLQIGEVLLTQEEMKAVDWHPHAKDGEGNPNAIFVASEKLLDTDLPGYGTFKLSDELILTKPRLSRSKWVLPECMIGREISYHKPTSQKDDYFQSAMIGQEFVMESSENIEQWIKRIASAQRRDD